jgi:hypothetical protein
MRTLPIGLVALLLLAGCGGKPEPSCSPAKEIATSRVVKTGDTWDVAITSNIEAPVDKVLEAAARLDILPPGFKVQNIKTEYTYYPQEKRFTTRSIDFKLADITSEYKFAPSPDGKGTVLTFTQKSKDKAPMIVESLQKGALCETFVIQAKVVRRALGLDAAKPG